MTGEWLTRAAVLRILGLRADLDTLIATGELTAIRSGARLRVSEESLEHYIARRNAREVIHGGAQPGVAQPGGQWTSGPCL